MNEWWRDELEKRESAHLRRGLKLLPDGVLDLASNDYLGLARHPEVIAAACDAAQTYGAGARASRLVSGHTPLHQRLESELARFKQCDAALLFPSGYHANLGVVSALARPLDLICCDKRNHASLIDACLLAQARGTIVRYYDSLPKLQALLEVSTHAARLIVSDAVYSMDGDIAPIPDLLQLAAQFDATLILDDAHGTEVLGQSGRGAMEYFEERGFQFEKSQTLVQIGTLSKALGAQGGFVAGGDELISWLINAARPFIYTTALNPASCGAALAALKIMKREPQRLQRLHEVKEKLARGLSNLGYDARLQPAPIIPVVIGDAGEAVALGEKLLEGGVWCPAIRPPTVPQNSSRLRVTANSELTDADIGRVLSVFADCKL
jgi:8-amino-7-oxononanoate synthase